MSKLNAPLLSFGARGQIGKSMVIASWKGLAYARQYVVPANPRSTEQTSTRNVFDWCNQVYKRAPAEVLSAFTAYADGQPMTDRNAFIKFNLSPLRPETDNDLMTYSPGARAGLGATGVSFTPGDDQITVAASAPVLPSGWTITQLVGAVMRQQDPHDGTLYDIISGTDVSDPYSIVIAGLDDAQTYVCGAWFEFTRPDGKTAYGPAVMGTALTT